MMQSYIIPLVFTGLIFMILIGLLFFWLYKDNQHKVFGCVSCRKLFMKHKHLLDDNDSYQKTLMYQKKSATKLVNMAGDNDLTCVCQRFGHVTNQNALPGNVPVTPEGTNVTLNLNTEGQTSLKEVSNCDVVMDGCQKCHGCKCSPVTMYRTLERSSSGESASEPEVTLSLTPEISFVMQKECKCGCQDNLLSSA